MTSATLPSPLREIGFDQNLGKFVLLDTESAAVVSCRCFTEGTSG